MLLRPLHNALFEILQKIENDATFDQARGVMLARTMLLKKGFAASLDLSAATDRLPVLLQSQLLNHRFNGAGSP
jgi:hypothetical protein